MVREKGDETMIKRGMHRNIERREQRLEQEWRNAVAAEFSTLQDDGHAYWNHGVTKRAWVTVSSVSTF